MAFWYASQLMLMLYFFSDKCLCTADDVHVPLFYIPDPIFSNLLHEVFLKQDRNSFSWQRWTVAQTLLNDVQWSNLWKIASSSLELREIDVTVRTARFHLFVYYLYFMIVDYYIDSRIIKMERPFVRYSYAV